MNLLSCNKDLILTKEVQKLLSIRNTLKQNTNERPAWLHFGSGNIFRSYIAFIAQKLIVQDLLDTGIIVCEAYDEEILDISYKPNDCISLSCTLNNDGTFDINLVLSVVKALCINKDKDDRAFYLKALKNESLQIISFSITEKAYELYDANGLLLVNIKQDLDRDLSDAKSILPLLLLGLYNRFKETKAPLTLLALDNCKHNGDKLKHSILHLAKLYFKQGKLEESFLDYLDKSVSYPLSMIDKIAPRPDENILKKLLDKGFVLNKIVKTKKGTYTCDFVNSEKTAYLVIEDDFKNQRPPFDKANVCLTDRDTVMLCERMKIESLLNPLQTAVALCGMLLSKIYISDCMQDKNINLLVRTLGQEGLLVVEDPKVIKPLDFLYEAIDIRMPNPYINDTPARIATDSSCKIPIRLGLNVIRYINEHKDVLSLKAIPLVYALFIRYCAGYDDNLEKFNLANDLNLNYLKAIGLNINVNNPDAKSIEAIDALLCNIEIMGVDLKACNMYQKIFDLTLSMCQGKGSIQKTLEANL